MRRRCSLVVSSIRLGTMIPTQSQCVISCIGGRAVASGIFRRRRKRRAADTRIERATRTDKRVTEDAIFTLTETAAVMAVKGE